MADWTDIPNESLEPDAPVRSIDGLAFRDNPIAIAEGAAGAPLIAGQQSPALRNGGIPNGEIGAEKFQSGNDERDWVLARTAGAAAGAVGTYAFAWRNSTDTPPAFGGTVSGSQLRPAGLTSGSPGVGVSTITTSFPAGSDINGSDGSTASSFAGTWRCMGEARRTSNVQGNYPHTLWLRIS